LPASVSIRRLPVFPVDDPDPVVAGVGDDQLAGRADRHAER